MKNTSNSTSLLQQPVIRFAGVGLVSTIIDIVLLNIFNSLGVPLFFSTALGFLAGATNGYFLNSSLVFKTGKTTVRYGKYLIVSLGGFIITELLVNYLHNGIGVNKAKLVAVVVVFFWNYGLSKVWAFK